MVRFSSDYNDSQARYETACREANASDQTRRRSYRDEIVDNLVEGGLEAIQEYEVLMDSRWKAAQCLAEYDGVSMGYANAKLARERLELPTREEELRKLGERFND
jgi:hypothetical protein